MASSLIRFDGKLTRWNDDRGFGTIESTQGGKPIFMHISEWPRDAPRPRVDQRVSFEIEQGPKGKRATRIQPLVPRRTAARAARPGPAAWGTATLFVIPAFLLLYLGLSVLWRLPLWVGGLYLGASVVAFLAYAQDKSAAERGAWRTPESTLHTLALLGGWPGALLAQQWLRHKSSKPAFRRVFWATVMLNVAALAVLGSPLGAALAGAAG
ncbi:cold shock and DUF1294 domain-containing protein [Rubrivivax benzoatilyticus]|uniref:cold shock and DUF1294 domain-containing protein n=1 Tax=Rubrivivax benzoatilyticus TaxID=316997 RepID=UPI00020A4CB5|nr:cold shock and DUF1294 domain-containing protein [Rubrivivax benzoatilyticus]EGJ11313.1 cold-shock DNA-binding domain-containing protein [Rubrivivax benzoatilyticus JA2 = ATCC BAA-35]